MTGEVTALINRVSSPEDFARFVDALRKELMESPQTWESLTLPDYLEAMSAWLRDASRSKDSPAHAFLNEGASWRTFARIMTAASIYE
jgi:hypothetical protein